MSVAATGCRISLCSLTKKNVEGVYLRLSYILIDLWERIYIRLS